MERLRGKSSLKNIFCFIGYIESRGSSTTNPERKNYRWLIDGNYIITIITIIIVIIIIIITIIIIVIFIIIIIVIIIIIIFIFIYYIYIYSYYIYTYILFMIIPHILPIHWLDPFLLSRKGAGGGLRSPGGFEAPWRPGPGRWRQHFVGQDGDPGPLGPGGDLWCFHSVIDGFLMVDPLVN